LAKAEPAAGRALHLPGFTFYGEAGLMLFAQLCRKMLTLMITNRLGVTF